MSFFEFFLRYHYWIVNSHNNTVMCTAQISKAWIIIFIHYAEKLYCTYYVYREYTWKRNTLDCDQSNYFSRIVFSNIPIEFDQTEISAIRSADLENLTLEPNMKWIGRPLAEIWPFEIYPILAKWEVGRSVLNIYFFLHWSHILLFATLGT